MKKIKVVDPEETETDESVPPKTEEVSVRKPRIRIKVKAAVAISDDVSSKKISGNKRKKAPDGESEPSHGDSNEAILEPIPKKTKTEIKSVKLLTRKEKQSVSTVEQRVGNPDTGKKSKQSALFNLTAWKKNKQSLDGSFQAARDYLMSQGRWVLPPTVPDDKFAEVAREVLSRMKKIDKYNVFAEPVTEDEAPGYFEIVDNPMDFATMKKKAISGEYGSGSEAASKFYDDMVLIFDNCLLYNDEGGDIAEEAIRIMSLVPETYVLACFSVAKKGK